MAEIKTYCDADARRWDQFVEECPQATFFHRSGWKEVIERAFGHQTHYLYLEREGDIEGILPLAHVRSLFFGNALISCPFCVYGGVAAISDSAGCALEEAAVELAGQMEVDHLELRNREGGPNRPGWEGSDLYVTFRKGLDAEPENNMRAIPRKQRAMVRKGIKAGLVSQLDDGVDTLFRMYATSVRNLGTPVFSKRYFTLLRQVFGDDVEVLTVTKDRSPVSSVMSFYFRDEVLPYYAGGTLMARSLKANDFMYWELMRRSCERGIRTFDYGRSKRGVGSYSFKKNWGFEPVPLNYRYKLVKADRVPEVNPLNPKYRHFINIWKRLPLPVANLLGPYISRNLG